MSAGSRYGEIPTKSVEASYALKTVMQNHHTTAGREYHNSERARCLRCWDCRARVSVSNTAATISSTDGNHAR